MDNLLVGPAPHNCTSQHIDFSQTNVKDLSGSFALIIDNLLTPAECSDLLNAAEATTAGHWEQAMINIGGGRQMLITEARLCGRIIWDEKTLAERLLDRIMPHLPERMVTLRDCPAVTGRGPVRRKEIWKLTRLNERLRFLKYTAGMYFRPHHDGSYVTPDNTEVSFLTVHLYLNGDPANAQPSDEGMKNTTASKDDLPLVGGATRFFSNYNYDKYLDVKPVTGSCLIFQHRDLLHSGDDVIQGTKYTVRTDIMYTLEK